MKARRRLNSAIRICFLVLILLSVAWSLMSQGVYEMEYRFGEINYRTLFLFYSVGSEDNVMRTRYFDGGSWNIVEQKAAVVFLEHRGKKYWTIMGREVKVISGRVENYYPDEIFLAQDPADGYYKPDFVACDYNGNLEIGEIISFVPLEESNIDNEHLALYNWKWEKEESKGPDDVGTLHLILVTNSNDPSLGMGFQVNHEKLKALFKDVSIACHLNLRVHEIAGRNFSRNQVLSTIHTLSPGERDVIIFYYSGHGFNHSGDWPNLDLRQSAANDPLKNSLSLDNDIYQPLIGKQARLTIVVADCGNDRLRSSLVGKTPVREDPVMLTPCPMKFRESSFKKLLSRKGKLLIASSDALQPSYYGLRYGGEFSNNFIGSILNNTGFSSACTDLKWRNIFNGAYTNTVANAMKIGRRQNPIFAIDIEE